MECKTTTYKRLRPWYSHWELSRSRCNNKNNPCYKYYGKRGIKCFLSKEDIVFLWKRDRGDLLKRPSIDRIDNDGNYTLENCRFIEVAENARLGAEKTMRRVVQKSLDGKVIKIHKSVANANRSIGRYPDSSNIFDHLSGKTKKAYGYLWEYYDKQLGEAVPKKRSK